MFISARDDVNLKFEELVKLMKRKQQHLTIIFVLFIFGLNLVVISATNQQTGSLSAAGIQIEIKEVHLHGLVLNEFGYPVPGVTVNFELNGVSDYSATTNGTGYYSLVILTELPADFTVTVQRSGYATFTASFSVPSISGNQYDKQVDVELQKSSNAAFLLEGVVVDYDTNAVISGATVTVWPEEVDPRNPTPIAQVTTDSSGYFYVSKGQRSPWYQYYGLDVSKSGYASFNTLIGPPINTAEPDYTYEEIALSSGGYTTIHGKIRADDGNGNMKSYS